MRITDFTCKTVFADEFSGSTYVLKCWALESVVYFVEIGTDCKSAPTNTVKNRWR